MPMPRLPLPLPGLRGGVRGIPGDLLDLIGGVSAIERRRNQNLHAQLSRARASGGVDQPVNDALWWILGKSFGGIRDAPRRLLPQSTPLPPAMWYQGEHPMGGRLQPLPPPPGPARPVGGLLPLPPVTGGVGRRRGPVRAVPPVIESKRGKRRR